MTKRRDKGEGSVFWSQSNNLWVGKITLPDGKQKRKRSKDKAVVQEWLLDQRKALSENRILLPSRRRVVNEVLTITALHTSPFFN